MQSEFSKALLEPSQPTPQGVIRPDGKPAGKRFDVYRNNVVVSLIGALGDGYPAVRKTVGEKFFDAVASVYVRSHPPKTPLMIFYGDSFADFLDRFEPAQQIPYLADVARLEWARRRAYHARDVDPADPAALGTMSSDDLMAVVLDLHPSLSVITSQFPVLDIWNFNMNGGDAPTSADSAEIAILRPGDKVEMHALVPGCTTLLTALGAGENLGAAADHAASSAATFDLGEALGQIFVMRAITHIRNAQGA